MTDGYLLLIPDHGTFVCTDFQGLFHHTIFHSKGDSPVKPSPLLCSVQVSNGPWPPLDGTPRCPPGGSIAVFLPFWVAACCTLSPQMNHRSAEYQVPGWACLQFLWQAPRFIRGPIPWLLSLRLPSGWVGSPLMLFAACSIGSVSCRGMLQQCLAWH